MVPAKRHHYVPVWYLKNFATNSRIRTQPRNRASYVSSVDNTGVENHLYTDHHQDAPAPDHVESHIAAEVDAPASKAIRVLLRKGTLSVTDSAWEAIDRFVAWQLVRTPRSFQMMSAIDDGLRGPLIELEAASRLVTRYEEQGLGEPTQEVIDRLVQKVRARPLMDWGDPDPRRDLRMMIRMADDAQKLLRSRVRLIHSGSSDVLVTSDHPAQLFAPTGPVLGFSGFLPSTNEVWIPLSPRVLLVYGLPGPRDPFVAPGSELSLTGDVSGIANELQSSGCHQQTFGAPNTRNWPIGSPDVPQVIGEPSVSIKLDTEAKRSHLSFRELESEVFEQLLADLGAPDPGEEL